jgi:hypothetical protein
MKSCVSESKKYTSVLVIVVKKYDVSGLKMSRDVQRVKWDEICIGYTGFLEKKASLTCLVLGVGFGPVFRHNATISMVFQAVD